jgi:hypothetical protein
MSRLVLSVLVLGIVLTAAAAEVRVVWAATGLPVAAAGASPDRGVLTDFRAGQAGEAAAVQTRAVVWHDQEALHVRIECREPAMDRLRAACMTHDGPVFGDDCIEIFLSPSASGTPYYHFAANPAGTRFEQKLKDVAWEAPWTAVGGLDTEGWRLEVTIPFATLGARPEPGALWRLNLGRERQAGGATELSSWTATGADFHDAASFGYLVFAADYATCLTRNVLEPWQERVATLEARLQAAANAAGAAALIPRLRAAAQSLDAVRAAARRGAALTLPEFAGLLQQSRDGVGALALLEGDVDDVVRSSEVARAMRRLARRGQSLVVYSVPPISNARILPVPTSVPTRVSERLAVTACRGEYEPASFVVYPFIEITDLQVIATELKGRGGRIPASAIDLAVVKCWYQSGEGGMYPLNQHRKILTPELLVRDDSLVRVDPVQKENYVKLVLASGETCWRWISNPTPTAAERDLSVAAFPVRDAGTLQPVTIPGNTAKQFWVTVQVPAAAASGTYEGSIELRQAGRLLRALPLRLEVLPFDLQPNPLESSLYFHWGFQLDVDGPGAVDRGRRNVAQYRAELENLLAHGVNNPTVCVPFGSGRLPLVLKLRQEVGLRNDPLYYLVASAAAAPETLREIIAEARPFGVRDLYFYGTDEASGEALKAQRTAWESVHAAGGKVFVAGCAGDNYALVGDIQDLLICAGRPSREEAAKWHSQGHRVFCYAHPQSGIEEPETYRRNYGLLLERSDYDGGMTFLYYDQWNDYDGTPYRGHNFVYPTVNGVIDTVQWEGYREGIDDLRYLATLRQAIAAAEAAPSARQRRRAAAARQFVAELEVSGDLDAVRRALIDWTLRLHP